ncbi:MAG: hypothetical protein LBL95_05835 [Deltaproteobacteria bacterium]|nr:hypothetical protein [Deltaproteobacteria bacterium]
MRWRLVDRILDHREWLYLAALKYGTLEEYRLLERWGEPARVPPLLILESAFQAARWLVEASGDFGLTFLQTEVSGFKAGQGLAPAEGIIWLVKVASQQDDSIGFVAFPRLLTPALGPLEAHDDLMREYLDPPGKPDSAGALGGDCLRFSGDLVPLAGREDADSQRALWRELNRPLAGAQSPDGPWGERP